MPEGHTIHRAALRHRELLAGPPLAAGSPQGRFAEGARELDGRRLLTTEAAGKHLLYRFEEGRLLHVHLGLFGRFRVHAAPVPPPRDTVRLRLATGERALDLSGPIVCALTDEGRWEELLARLGPDPLRADADPGRFVAALAARRTPVGTALLDQGVIAGVGNVFRAEALFLCGIDPRRPSRELTADQALGLWEVLARLLRDGVRRGRIVTVARAELGGPPSRARRADRTYVYRQATCRRCGGTVDGPALGGRPCYRCAACQA